MRNLILRAATVVVLLPLVIAVLFIGGYLLAFFVGVLSCLCCLEMAKMIGPEQGRILGMAMLFWASAFFPAFFYNHPPFALSLLFFGILVFHAIVLFSASITQETVQKFGLLFFWSFYVTLSLATVYWLQNPTEILNSRTGISFILLGCISTWSNDTFAYLGGRAFGRHGLFKRVSAKKTWEGFLCGSIFSFLIVLIIKYFPPVANLDWLRGINFYDILWIQIPAMFLAPFGDLVESRLKRLYHTKDASNILPGHGGVLDRIDSILTVLPWTAIYAFFIRPMCY